MICPIRIDDDSEESQSSDNIYNVEFVYGKKLQKQIALYAVKWIGFSIKQMTWEPKTNFTSQSLYLIQRFESRLAYKIYQRQYNPKKETIRVHIKQRFCQVYIAANKPLTEKQEIQQFTNTKQGNRQIIQNERKVSKINDDEYDKAQQIIDEWKKNLGLDEEEQENNKLNKQNKQGKKQIKLQQKFSEEIINSPPPKKTKKTQKCQKQKNESNTDKHSIDGDLERDIQLLIEREKQNQLKKQTQKKEKIESINLNNKKIRKNQEETNQNIHGIQKIENKSEITQKIQKKQKNQTRKELDSKKKGGIKANIKKQVKQDPFEIQINLSDDDLAFKSQDIHKEIIPQVNQEFQKILVQKIFKVVKSAQNVPEFLKNKNQQQEKTDNLQDQTQQVIYKSEREYLNDIIVAQRKKELEIYRSGNLIEAIKKDLKTSGQPKTSQQLQQEIQRIQLEKIANNKPARCSVPIVPKLKDQQIQVDEIELLSVEIKQQKIIIGSITSHCMIKNTLIYKCLLENGDELNQEFQSLSALCPKILLDYMKVNSILI